MRLRFFAIIIIVQVSWSNCINAQTFEDARRLAFKGEYTVARELCKEILLSGFNSDVALLLGRTYSWDGKYDSARVVFNEVLNHFPDNIEVYGGLADVEYWSENYSKAVEYCDMALKKDPLAENFVMKKAIILNSAEKYEKAVTTLEEFNRKNPGDTEVVKMLKEYRLNLMKNRIKILYTIDVFDKEFNRDPWQVTSLSYGRTTKIGSVITRVNYAKRFGESGLQYEIDAYPNLGEKSYGYFNYGFSKDNIFPESRLGLEWYHNFPNAFEGSAGMRMLFFNGSNVNIYTTSLGKYAGNYWVSMRAYVTPGTDETSVSGSLRFRRYFLDPENYYGVKLSYGILPDENRYLIDSKQRLAIKNMAISAEFNHFFKQLWIINTKVALGAEERIPNAFTAYSNFELSLTRLF